MKVNTVPSQCVIEVDIRLPVGLDKNRVMEAVEKILTGYPQVSVEELVFSPPAWCDPGHEMMKILQDNVEAWVENGPSRFAAWVEPTAVCGDIWISPLLSTDRHPPAWGPAMNTWKSRHFSTRCAHTCFRLTTI